MIIEVTETIYKGILIERVKDEGWICNLGGTEYLFPNYTAAQAAIDEIFHDVQPIVSKRKGKKLKKQETRIALTPDERFEALKQSFMEHLRLDNEFENVIKKVVDAGIEALHNKDYEEAEALLASLAEELCEE